MTFKRPKELAFTLLELAVMLTVLSFMLGGALTIATQKIRAAKQAEVQAKMDAIEKAVYAFRKANGRIPCPSSSNSMHDDNIFGWEGTTPGNCTGGGGIDFSDGSNVVAGMVPVRTLALPDNYAFDPWGGRFLYVADLRATSASTFTPTQMNTGAGTLNTGYYTGDIIIKDEQDTTIVSVPLLILSFGPNGHGAFTTAANTRKYIGSTNTDEWANCGCDATSQTGFDVTFYVHSPTTTSAGVLTSFDDIGRYYTRQKLLSPTSDGLTEKP